MIRTALLALVLAASPAVAQEMPAVPGPVLSVPSITAQVPPVQPSPQAEDAKRLRVQSAESAGPVRPGEEFGVEFFVGNGGEDQEFALTVTLAPEVTLVSLGGGPDVACSGNVCRGIVGRQASQEADNTRQISFRGRVSSSFRGTTTTVRGDLQEDANEDQDERTTTTIVAVEQPASRSSDAGGKASSPSDGGSAPAGSQTLPVTGGHAPVAAGLALLVLGLAVGRRRVEDAPVV